jgi:hypothetical protein
VFQDLAPYNARVTPRVTGLLAGADAVAWREALVFLIENPKERLKMAATARREVLAEHTLGAGKELFWECYDKVARGES